MLASDPNPRTPDDDSLVQGRNWLSARLESLLFAITPSCGEMTRLISMSLDRPPGFRGWLRLRLHYLICCYCSRYERHLRGLRRVAICLAVPREDALDSLDEAAKERIKTSLRRHS